MTVDDILEQVKALSPEEREELVRRLEELPIEHEALYDATGSEKPEHWGKSLAEIMDEIGPIELKYPEIEDPVEWVKRLRADERKRRLGDLDNWAESDNSDLEETE
jgi:hypothetical protein